MVNQQIPRHTGDPGGKASVRRAVTPQCPEHSKEHILCQVLGFRAVAREPVTDVEDAARMATHKFLPGRAFALETLLDQLGILLQASLAPSSSHLLWQHPQVGISACHSMERKMHRKCSLPLGIPTDHLAGILPTLPRTYNSFACKALELKWPAALDATPAVPVTCFLMHVKSRKALLAGLAILVAGLLFYHFRGS